MVTYRILHISTGEILNEDFPTYDRAESYIRFLVCMTDGTSTWTVKNDYEVLEFPDEKTIKYRL